MDKLLQFITNHPYLWLALFVILGLLIIEELRKNLQGVIRVSAQKATNLINHEHASVVDIRTAAEFQAGHVTAARNLDGEALLADLQQDSKLKDKAVILTDNDGTKAIAVGARLRKQGFEKIYVLEGGIAAWKKAGLPLVKN